MPRLPTEYDARWSPVRMNRLGIGKNPQAEFERAGNADYNLRTLSDVAFIIESNILFAVVPCKTVPAQETWTDRIDDAPIDRSI